MLTPPPLREILSSLQLLCLCFTESIDLFLSDYSPHYNLLALYYKVNCNNHVLMLV